MKKPRLALSLGVAAAVILAVCYIPLPHHVDSAFQVDPVVETATVYAGTQGRIEWAVPVGAQVKQGDVLARLENLDLDVELVELTGEELMAHNRLRTLERMMHNDRGEASAQMSAQQKLIISLADSRAKAAEKVNRLTIHAPRDGYVLPPPRKQPQGGDDGRLPSWTGSPLEEVNRGALLSDSDVVYLVGPTNALEAVLVIDQGDVQLVREGMKVDLKFDAARMDTYHGTMGEVSFTDLSMASMALSSQTGGDLQTEIDPSTGQAKPRSISYQSRVSLDIQDFPIRIGYRGSAKIHTEPKSLGWRLWRIITQTFNFEL